MTHNIFRHTLLLCLGLVLLVLGCERESSDPTAEYGYVQFRLVKATHVESSTRATDALDWLSDAHKIEIVMQRDGATIAQSMPVASFDAESAEWGLYTEKLKLLTGRYNIIGYYIYDNLDNKILVGGNAGEFKVITGGLTQKDIGVSTQERGKISFSLHKDLATRSEAEGNYPFESIRSVDISLRNNFTKKTITFKALPTTYHEDFVEGAVDEELYDRNAMTSYMTCGGEYWIEAGEYTLTSYTTYSDANGRNRLETASVAEKKLQLTVEDNKHITIDVPIFLSTTAEYIKDYEALKEIWLALDGPNWTFHGEEYVARTNWDFNRDIDMWGDQPGVTLGGDGRIVGLNISGFGAKGVVPDAIGQLTELQMLYLGNHNELIGGYDSSTSARLSAMDYHDKFVKCDGREMLSPELKDVINADGQLRPITQAKPVRQDVAFGNLTNGITGISRAMMRLTKLEQFFIANAPIDGEFFVDVKESSEFYAESEEWSWAKLESLTDVEIYNCSKLTQLPVEMLCGAPNIQSLNLSMNQGISGEQLLADWKAIIDGESGEDVQILYFNSCNLEATPEHDYLKRMTKLGLLDLSSNKLKEIHPFGKDIYPTTLYYDNNRITHVEPAEDGYFCGLGQLETFSCSNNLLTELPDIFSASSVHSMITANFSGNKISALANGDGWRGINCETLNLADNHLTELPARLIGSGSRIETLMLGSNGIREIKEGALTGPYSYYLSTIDLSYNRLKAIPEGDFSAENIPYLYGIDLSNNALESFPKAPLGVESLTVISVRCQRDDNGNRSLKEWPIGIGNCPKLAALYIGSNDIGKVEDTISPYILIFEIKDNPNIDITLSQEICDLIKKEYYLLVYDSTQNIKGCDALLLE